jgi:hypothetical protein
MLLMYALRVLIDLLKPRFSCIDVLTNAHLERRPYLVNCIAIVCCCMHGLSCALVSSRVRCRQLLRLPFTQEAVVGHDAPPVRGTPAGGVWC